MNATDIEKPDRLDIFKQQFPRVFHNADLPFGLECSAGWDPLIATLCTQIDHILRQAPGASIQIRQIKEKFGALRFYYGTSGLDEARTQVLRELVSRAERNSQELCENCGRPRQSRRNDWILTLCDACAQAKGYR